MKTLSALILISLLTACMPQSGTVNKTQKTSSNRITDFVDGTGSGSGSGTGSGSGSQTGVELDDLTEPTEEETQELTEYCGKFYRSKNGTFWMILDEDGKYYQISPESENANSVVGQVKFPNDSYNACIWGNKALIQAGTSATIKITYEPTYTLTYLPAANFVANYNQIDTEYITLKEKIVHPERETKGNSFGYKLCGNIYMRTDNGKTVPHIEITVSPYAYILVDTTSGKALESYMNSNGVANGCLYSNKPDYKNTTITFKRFFDVQDIDLGWPTN